MHKLLWIIPLAIIAAAIWGVTFVPIPVLAVVGGVCLVLIAGGLVALAVLWLFAAAMQS